jgi:hypothetical protein
MVAKDPQSEQLRSSIFERLESCDENTMAKIADVLDSIEYGTREEAVLFSDGVTRRQFLVGLTAGGAALVSTNLATGLAELIKLRGLLTLYEQLERVGIDAILTTGVAALAISLDGLEAGIVVLEKGVSLVDAGVTAFENSFPTIRRGLRVVESLFTSMENRVAQLQETMSEIQEVVSPLSDAVGSVLSSLVERIPGVGPAMLDALDRISGLVGSLPDAIREVRTRLVEPLREEWFTDDEESGLKGKLLNPLQEHLLEPLEKFLGNLADSMDAWQEQLITPVEEAVSERELIRQQITEYKEREGMV